MGFDMKEQHKLLASPIWFTLHDGECIGILIMNDGFQDKAYIGRGEGQSELADIDHILAWGTKFPIDSAKVLFGLDKKEESTFVHGDDYETIDVDKHREFNHSQALKEQDKRA